MRSDQVSTAPASGRKEMIWDRPCRMEVYFRVASPTTAPAAIISGRSDSRIPDCIDRTVFSPATKRVVG
jgi:hypothetical protein